MVCKKNTLAQHARSQNFQGGLRQPLSEFTAIVWGIWCKIIFNLTITWHYFCSSEIPDFWTLIVRLQSDCEFNSEYWFSRGEGSSEPLEPPPGYEYVGLGDCWSKIGRKTKKFHQLRSFFKNNSLYCKLYEKTTRFRFF